MCCSRTTSMKESLRNLKGVESARKLENNTYEVTYKDGCRAIRLHRTDIVTFRPDGKFVMKANSVSCVAKTESEISKQYMAQTSGIALV